MHSSLNNAFPLLFLWYGEPSPAAMWFMRSIQENEAGTETLGCDFSLFSFRGVETFSKKSPDFSWSPVTGLLLSCYNAQYQEPMCPSLFMHTYVFKTVSWKGYTYTHYTHTHTGIHLHLKDWGLMKQIHPLIHTHRITLERRKMVFWRKPLKAVGCER